MTQKQHERCGYKINAVRSRKSINQSIDRSIEWARHQTTYQVNQPIKQPFDKSFYQILLPRLPGAWKMFSAISGGLPTDKGKWNTINASNAEFLHTLSRQYENSTMKSQTEPSNKVTMAQLPTVHKQRDDRWPNSPSKRHTKSYPNSHTCGPMLEEFTIGPRMTRDGTPFGLVESVKWHWHELCLAPISRNSEQQKRTGRNLRRKKRTVCSDNPCLQNFGEKITQRQRCCVWNGEKKHQPLQINQKKTHYGVTCCCRKNENWGLVFLARLFSWSQPCRHVV